MPLYKLTDQNLEAVPSITFPAEAILERKHLQKLIVVNVSTLDQDLLVLAEEYGEWGDARRRGFAPVARSFNRWGRVLP
jgi:hypothetical protein